MKKYVVLRGGVRVSDDEFDSPELAESERLHWEKVVSKWPDGTKVTVVEKNE